MVFITGGTGLVGSFVIRHFLQQGYPVTALRRAGSDMHLLHDCQDKVQWVEGDILDIPLLSQVIQPNSIVIHAAAIVSYSPSRKEEMFKTNVEGTANMVNVCLEQGVRKFCFVSSIAALGKNKQQTEIDESAKWEDSDLNTSYGQSKYLAETEVWRAAAEGLPVVIVNPSIILGAGDWQRSSTQLFHYAYKEKPFYPNGSVNYVDVRDVARAIFLLANTEIIGEKFILNAGTVNYKKLLEQIAQRFGKRPPHWKVQPWMSQLLWRMEWIKSLFSKKEPLLTRETAKLSQIHYLYPSDKIKKELNFTFNDLADTLDWACTAFVQKKSGH